MNYENCSEIKILREYLRIPSVHPNINYEPCVEFLKRQAVSLNLPISVHYPSKLIKPVVVITMAGEKPSLPTIMLCSHMDVVPVFPEKWTYPPFAAELDEDGKIFGRGVQDAKTLGIQYLAAVRALQKDGFKGQRTLHIVFLPEHEVGSIGGMKNFVLTNAFRDLNVGFALGEGNADISEKCNVVYGERMQYQLTFKINGCSGESSFMPKNSTGEKLQYILNKLMTLRKEQSDKLHANRNLSVGDVTTVNLTKVTTAAADINLPPLMEATFDVRLERRADVQRFEAQILQWCEEAGGKIDVSTDPDLLCEFTDLSENNLYWMAMKGVLEDHGIEYVTTIGAANTDMKYLRNKIFNIPALGFSYMPRTPNLAHGIDEYLDAETFLTGIELYEEIIPALVNAGVRIVLDDDF